MNIFSGISTWKLQSCSFRLKAIYCYFGSHVSYHPRREPCCCLTSHIFCSPWLTRMTSLTASIIDGPWHRSIDKLLISFWCQPADCTRRIGKKFQWARKTPYTHDKIYIYIFVSCLIYFHIICCLLLKLNMSLLSVRSAFDLSWGMDDCAICDWPLTRKLVSANQRTCIERI